MEAQIGMTRGEKEDRGVGVATFVVAILVSLVSLVTFDLD